MNRRPITVPFLFFILIGLLGCNQSANQPASEAPKAATAPASAPGANKKITIGLLPKLTGVNYFNAAEKGAKEAGAELGVEVVYDGPVTNDVTKQAAIIDAWVMRKFDAICVAPNDPTALAPALQKARRRGVRVLTFDADATPESREFFVNQCTYEAIGRKLVDTMAEGAGPAAKYVILTGSLTAANQNLWMKEMEAYRAQKYPQMKNLSATPFGTEEDQAKATQITIDVLKTYPELQGIFAITSVALPGAAVAFEKENAKQRVFLTGLATPNSMREYIKNGITPKVILWNPTDLGYLTIQVATQLVKGTLTPQSTSIKAGRMGELKVANGEIVMGEPTVFTKENVDNFHF